jgi:hypothetical protein
MVETSGRDEMEIYRNEKDHAALERAVKTGKVEAVFEEDR